MSDLHAWLVKGELPDKWQMQTIAEPMKVSRGFQQQIDRARRDMGEALWQELNREFEA